MNNFKDSLNWVISPEAQISKAHSELVKFSGQSPGNDDGYSELCTNVEMAAFAVLLECAKGVVKPNKREKLSENINDLYQNIICIAGISMMRWDIAQSKPNSGGRDRFFMGTRRTSEYKVVTVASDADSAVVYKYNDWRDQRLEALKKSLDLGANIIVMGEFDYPPHYRTDDDQDFNNRVMSLINEYNHGIFLIAGTRHEDTGEEPNKWFNHAKIFANKHLNSIDRADDAQLEFPINHAKLVPAESMGEKIDTPFPTQISYYETSLGQIAVLICKDAYSPNVIFSLINQRNAGASERLDYILIPSYNPSRKLYYACQVLSYSANTTVLLVDTCSESADKPAHVALFVCGRLFSDALKNPPNGSDNAIGEMNEITDLPGNIKACVWELNRDYVITQKMGHKIRTPFLNEAETMKETLARKHDN